MGLFSPPGGRVVILLPGEEEKGLTNGDIWTKIHTITMAEVAVLMSNVRFGNCRRRKGCTAEEFVGAKRRILGLRRICAGLSSERMEC